MLQRRRIDIEFTTPAFCSGASWTAAEWREPSIRGQLRWWFRAIAGASLNGDVSRVRDAETELFGSTTRASRIRIRVCPPFPQSVAPGNECTYGRRLSESDIAELWGSPTAATHARLRVNGRTNPISYLGYGPIVFQRDRGPVFVRGRIDSGTPAAFFLQYDDAAIDSSALTLLKNALWAWCHLGGIGARSRRGFGSMQATRTEEFFAPANDASKFADGVKALLNAVPSNAPATTLPDWPYLSPLATIHASNRDYAKWDEAMSDAGAWLIGFRRRYGARFDERPAKRQRDYEWFAPSGGESHNAAAHGQPGHVPDRAGFGLPLPFGQFDTLSWDDHEHEGRRASPLLLHIAKFGARYHSIWTHIPSRLIPSDASLRCKDRRTTWSPTAEQDGIVREFLDDLQKKGKLTKVH